jgi:hypothetical protein
MSATDGTGTATADVRLRLRQEAACHVIVDDVGNTHWHSEAAALTVTGGRKGGPGHAEVSLDACDVSDALPVAVPAAACLAGLDDEHVAAWVDALRAAATARPEVLCAMSPAPAGLTRTRAALSSRSIRVSTIRGSTCSTYDARGRVGDVVRLDRTGGATGQVILCCDGHTFDVRHDCLETAEVPDAGLTWSSLRALATELDAEGRTPPTGLPIVVIDESVLRALITVAPPGWLRRDGTLHHHQDCGRLPFTKTYADGHGNRLRSRITYWHTASDGNNVVAREGAHVTTVRDVAYDDHRGLLADACLRWHSARHRWVGSATVGIPQGVTATPAGTMRLESLVHGSRRWTLTGALVQVT